MSDSLWALAFVGVIGSILIGSLIGTSITYDKTMKQAYDRGHAVQCLGREGYYWECDK